MKQSALLFLIILIQLQGCDWLFMPPCGGGKSFEKFEAEDMFNFVNSTYSHIVFYKTYSPYITQKDIGVTEVTDDQIPDSELRIRIRLIGETYEGEYSKDSLIFQDTLHIWYSPFADPIIPETYVPRRFRKVACSPAPPVIDIDSIFVLKSNNSSINYSILNLE